MRPKGIIRGSTMVGLATLAAGLVALGPEPAAASGDDGGDRRVRRAMSAGLLISPPPSWTDAQVKPSASAQTLAVFEVPAHFVDNRGQIRTFGKTEVLFSLSLRRATFYFTPGGVVSNLRGYEQTKPMQLSSANPRGPDIESSSSPQWLEHNLKLSFVNPDTSRPAVRSEEAQVTKLNFILGNSSSKWTTDVPTYKAIVYEDVWEGIDVRWSSTKGVLEHTLIVAPGASPENPRFMYEGANAIFINGNGDLVVRTAVGDQIVSAPVAYQQIDGRRVHVPSRFVLHGPGLYGFDVGSYDKRAELVIDPQLEWSTYLGGTHRDIAWRVLLVPDGSGDVVVAGHTFSDDFPEAFGPARTSGDLDAFVSRLTQPRLQPDGSRKMELLWSTYLGGVLGSPNGPARDAARGLDVDTQGNVYISGYTQSSDFPVWPRPGAYQQSHGGGTGRLASSSPGAGGSFGFVDDPAGTGFDFFDAFVTKLDRDGKVTFSTYLGGKLDDASWCVHVDDQGNVYVGGVTGPDRHPDNNNGIKNDFPTKEAFQPTYGGGELDAFFAKLNSTGTQLVWSTFFGGTGRDTAFDMAMDGEHNFYVTGGGGPFPTGLTPSTPSPPFPFIDARRTTVDPDAGSPYVAKFTPAGEPLFITRINGHEGISIAVDSQENSYVTGVAGHPYEMLFSRHPNGENGTPSIYFFNQGRDCSSGGGEQAFFVTKLDRTGSQLVYNTFFNANVYDFGYAIAVDEAGNAYVGGETQSGGRLREGLLTPGAFQTQRKGWRDALLMKLNPGGGLVYGTLFGGSGEFQGRDTPYGIVLDEAGGIYIAGLTSTVDFPVTAEAYQTSNAGVGPNGEFPAFPADAYVIKFSNLAELQSPPLPQPEPPGYGPNAIPQAVNGAVEGNQGGSSLIWHLWWEDELRVEALDPANKPLQHLLEEGELSLDEASVEWTVSFNPWFQSPSVQAIKPKVPAPTVAKDSVQNLQVRLRARYRDFRETTDPVTGSTETLPAIQILRAWNFNVGQWDELDRRDFTQICGPWVDVTTDVSLVTGRSAGDYISPDGEIRLSIQIENAGRGHYDLLRIIVE